MLLLTAHAVDPITVTVDEFSIMHAVWAQCLPDIALLALVYAGTSFGFF